MYSFFYSLFWFIIVITPIVFIHELGHFYFARLFGVQVEVFSIGFCKPLFKWKDKKGTTWQIGAIPLGGYVKMFGDENASSVPDQDKIDSLSDEEKQKSFHFKKLWQRFLIVFAGPFANYLLSFIVIATLFIIYGNVNITNEVVGVVDNSPAYHAGIKSGDIIVQLDDNKIENFDDLKRAISLNTGTVVKLGIVREDNFLDINIIPEIREFKDLTGNNVKMPQLGLKFEHMVFVKTGVVESFILAIKKIYNMSVMMIKAIVQMITGQRGTEDLGGPIKIAQYSVKFAEQGAASIFLFVAMISLNLGLVNLLPIPMLDGGHLFYYVIEGIIRRPINQKIQAIGFKLGFALLMVLMAFAIWNDIKNVLFFK